MTRMRWTLIGVSLLLVAGTSLPGTPSGAGSQETSLVQPGDFEYLGAFRLPPGGERPLTFEYGGSAMTFRPDGDPAGMGDGFPGSLYVMGHDRLAYGELPDGNRVAEVSIPAPVISAQVEELPQADFVQPFQDVAAGWFGGLDEITRTGLLYLDTSATGPRLHLTWGQHLQEGDLLLGATHAWFAPDLAAPDMQGPWYVGDFSPYSLTGYLLEIPAEWAALHAEGRVIGTGRFRDGGWSGMGPALIAYRPWQDDGSPAPAQSHLPATVLLLYASTTETDTLDRALAGYQHPDEWEGAAWITTSSGKTAVLFAGTKGVGAKYWYGFENPDGSGAPCIHEAAAGDYPACRLADGTPCPPSDLIECEGHNEMRGWWTSAFEAQFILYDPADLAEVASGSLQPWEPQPYAHLAVDEHLFLNPAGTDAEMLGTGVQRRMRLGEIAYDRAHDLLYVLELFADEARPVVHVWRVQ